MLPKRNVGLIGVTLASVGSMVGSGWLFGPMYAAQMAGPASITSWLLGGFCFVFIVLTFAELSSMFPIMGGLTSYPFFTHGKFSGILTGWIYFLCFVTISPIESLAVIQYASNYFPELVIRTNGKPELSTIGYFSSVIVLFIIVFINRFSVKFLTRTNSLATVWKLFVPLAIAMAFIFSTSSEFSNINHFHGFAPNGMQGIFASLSIGGIIFAFGGFQSGIILAGETKNPQRNIPLAALLSIFIVTLLYVIIQFAFIVAIPSEYLSEGWSKLSFTGDMGPFAGLALAGGFTLLCSLLYIDAVVSPFGSGLMMTSTTSRVLHTLGSIGAAPKSMTKLNKNGSPETSLWVCFFVGLILIFPFPGWKEMVTFLTSSFVLTLSVTPIALMVLRDKYPNAKRPFKLPFYHVMSLIAFCICGLMMHWIGYIVLLKLSTIITLFAIVFSLLKYKEGKKSFNKYNFKSSLWMIIYIIGFTIINYFSGFGSGIQKFSTLEGNLVAVLFSIIIFYFACYNSLSKEKVLENIKEFNLK
ncbi:APC family permease [Fluviispira multicolorata]|uniref:Amino acid permease n=1 Tax=Fluviispira multicolorata TaxID=2654512 RepID=A0A833N229_9BACT|nr:APC family permease [Fluviispira multicolorata]KAB8031942.1 amino acid permease [Fluviispira multicolorata]